MPSKYIVSGEKAAQGFHFLSGVDKKGFLITEIKICSYGERVINSSSKVIKQLADDRHNIVIDEVI
jgi:hypothetical protein